MARNSSIFIVCVVFRNFFYAHTMKSPTAWTIWCAGRSFKHLTIRLRSLVGHPTIVDNFFAFSRAFSVWVQQSSAVPLSDHPPVDNLLSDSQCQLGTKA